MDKKSGNIEYHGPDHYPIRVSIKDSLVSQIWFTRNTPFILNKINIFDEDLSITSEIIDSNFKK